MFVEREWRVESGVSGGEREAAVAGVSLFSHTKKKTQKKTGVKLGAFKVSDDCDPDNLDRGWHASDEAPLRAFLEKFAPRAAGARLNQSSCMFAMTPDNHFIIDAHPRCPQVRLRCLSYLFWGLLVRIANQRPSKHAHTK